MATLTCPACKTDFLTYDEGTPAPPAAIIAEGADVPEGISVVHVCAALPTMAMQKRASAALDWTDEQERSAVAAALPDWHLRADDEIVCMRWYTPGAGRHRVAAPSAPLTIQVRRAGVDLKYAGEDDVAEVSFGADAALELIDQLGIDLPAELAEAYAADQAAEERAAAAARALLERQASATAEAVTVWEQALADATREAEAAAAHAAEHPEDADLETVAIAAQAYAAQVGERLATVKIEADQAAAAVQ